MQRAISHRGAQKGLAVAGRRGDFYYLALIALAIAGAWAGLRLFGTGSGRPFQDSDLTALFRELELPPIELVELPFGFLRPSASHRPLPSTVRYADEIEVAIVQNRNQLLRTSLPDE